MNTLKVSEYIKRRIREKGITQDALAEKMHITSSAVSQVLSGKSMFDIINLQTLSRILDEPIDHILNAGEEPYTYLEVLALKSKDAYLKEDPELIKVNEKDHKGKTLYDYIIKHENIALLNLVQDTIFIKMKSEIKLETLLIKHKELDLLKKLYQTFGFKSHMPLFNDINSFESLSGNKNMKSFKELTDPHKEYINVLFYTESQEIYQIIRLFDRSLSHPLDFSSFIEYAITLDKPSMLKQEDMREISYQKLTGYERSIQSKYKTWMMYAIQNKSIHCMRYCYEKLEVFPMQVYFDEIILTKDETFINKVLKEMPFKENKKGYHQEVQKINNLKSLKELIRDNQLTLLDLATNFSNQEALDEALYETKEHNIEIMILLLNKGARFMTQDSYSSNKVVHEQMTSVMKYVLNNIKK
jgi:transcriptional regulator with XRE-family HTH domain